jgi:hypothetical protein
MRLHIATVRASVFAIVAIGAPATQASGLPASPWPPDAPVAPIFAPGWAFQATPHYRHRPVRLG